MEENEEITPSNRSSTILIIGSLIVVGLIIAGLFLPPISLGQRLGLGGDDPAAIEDAAVPDRMAIPGQINLSLSQGSANVNVDAGETDITALNDRGMIQGDVFTVAYEGDSPVGQVELTIPTNAAPLETLDLYGWDGASWRFIPSQIDSNTQQLVSAEGPLPQAVAMIQTAVVDSPTIGAELLPTQEFPVDILPHLTEVTAGTLTLADDGELLGEPAVVPTGAYDQLLRVTNTGAIVDQASLIDLLDDTAVQADHISALVEQVVAGSYAGLNLDYQGISADRKAAFTGFVTDLSGALHDQERSLAITLGTPQRVNTSWDTAGQDWATLSQIADITYLQMPLNPTVYDEDGVADQLINFATRQIDRHKIVLLTSANAIDKIGESFRELPNTDALANFGELQFVQGEAEVEPGTPVEVALSGTASPLEWDGLSLTYKYSYEQSDQTHHVWLGNEATLSKKLHLARTYNVRGVAVRGLGNVADGAGYAAAFKGYLGHGDDPQPAGAAIVWRVEGATENVLASSSGEALSFTWDGTEDPGDYSINVEFALGENVAPLGSLAVTVLEPPEPVVEEPEEPEEEAPDAVAAAPATGFDPGDADAVVNTAANVRLGPGLSYGTVAGGVQPGEKIELIGRSGDSQWFNIIMPDGKTEGWIYSTLVTVNASVNIASLPEVEAPPIVAGGDDGGGPGAPPPVSAPPVTNAGFELGGQTHGFANPTLMASAGMNWVKFQHKWGSGDSPDAVAGRIQQAHANGFKVLLSIPGSNTYPDSIDFNGYVNFLGGVAALGPDAIEVWNEMNIDFEWPAGQIDPASYVSNMLAPAYNAIKSANSSVMVISGAPAPTGFDNGTNAWSDSRYLSGMAAAGAANYMDCMGAHFNAGATSPYQSTGHPAGNDHYSWHFQPTLNLYAGLGKPVCFTELGYLSGEDFGGVPSRFSWAANTTVSQHAQWLGEAVSLGANSGSVRMIIIFNVDFTHFGDDPQAGYAMIRPGGGCPACETLRNVMGR